MGDIVPIRLAASPRSPLEADVRPSSVRELRAAWGREMRARRQAAGLSTRDLAEKMDLRSPTLLSAVEAGRGRLPDGKLLLWARALGVEPRLVAANYLRAFEPGIHDILFGPGQGEGV